MKSKCCHPEYELVVQSLALQTKILLNGVTPRLEPDKTRLNALLQTGNVNIQFPRGLSCWNCSTATVSSITELLTEHLVKADIRIESIFINLPALSQLCNLLAEHVFRSDNGFQIFSVSNVGENSIFNKYVLYQCYVDLYFLCINIQHTRLMSCILFCHYSVQKRF